MAMRFTVKAALANGSLPSTAGSWLVDERPRSAAPVVRRMLDAGYELAGVSNCAELALAPVAWSPRYGTTDNPAAPTRSPGGSSCGCAAAVARGDVAFGIGTDYGGSVRFPAFCTGTLGFRPARRAVPVAGQVPRPPPGSPRARFSTPGLLAADVDVLREVLPAFLGRPVAPREARAVAFVDDDDCDDDVRDAVVRAAARLSGTAAPAPSNPLEGADEVFTRIRATDDLEPIRTMARGREDELSEPVRRALAAPVLPVDDEVEAQAAAMRARALRFLRRWPLLVAPVARTVAPPAGDDTPYSVLAPCRAVSLLGVAALAVPTGRTADGIPVGVQLVGAAPELLWGAVALRPT